MTLFRIDLQDLALKYRGYLWALASASLGAGFRNQLDPADVVQATLLRAAHSLADSPVSDEQSLLAWLRQVLKNVLVDEYRRLHRDRRDIRREQQLLESGVDASAAGLQACLAADQTSPSLAAVRNERLLLLADALVQLPAEQREVVVQRYLEGRSVGAIADSLGRTTPIVCCTVDTVLGIIQNHRRGLYSWPALARSAFVFDEIHAYDDRLFGCLLRFLSDLRGTKVLLMTASLPTPRLAAIKQALEDEEPANIIVGPPELEQLPRYHREQPHDIDTRVREELARGGRVLWICNVVDRAMDVAARFADWTPLIYHSRFRYEDRVQRHKDVVAAFSQGSSQSGGLAICTQVAEMSLDISATLLVTEMAPVPSLIQRLGRLNRHARPAAPPPQTMPFVIDDLKSLDVRKREMPYSFDVYGDWPELTESWLDQLGDQNISQQSLSTAEERR